MSTLLSPLSKLYGRFHLGMPFGLNIRLLLENFDFHLTRLIHSVNTFSFNGHRYHYFYHQYNASFNNERIIEIPIAKAFYRHYKPKDILEIGNVLQHYGFRGHTIVDKYEKGLAVTNEDVVRFNPQRRFQLILSISTLEHVGYDEPEKNPEKIHQAITHVKSLLNPGGVLVFTVPIGSNPYLDSAIKTGNLKISHCTFLKRVSLKNRWVECSKEDALKHRYNAPYPFGNAIMVGYYQKP